MIQARLELFMSVPPKLPSLPEAPSGQWSPNVRAAHATLCSIYNHASQILNQEDNDPIRIAFHTDALSSDGLSLLQALESEGSRNPDQSLPDNWLHGCASIVGNLVLQLHRVKEAVTGQYVTNTLILLYLMHPFSDDDRVEIPELIKILPTGKRGRRSKIIDLDFLNEAMSSHRQIKKQEIADLLGIHRNTLYLHLKRHGVMRQYADISSADLDILTRTFKSKHPQSGLRYLIGFLRRHGLRVQNRRVRASMKRVDNLGKFLKCITNVFSMTCQFRSDFTQSAEHPPSPV